MEGVAAHLVKALQQAHDAALDLVLVESTAGAVHPHGLEALDLGHDGGPGRGGGEGGPLRGDGGSDGGTGGRGGAEDGGAEHCEKCGRSSFSIGRLLEGGRDGEERVWRRELDGGGQVRSKW